MYNILSRKSRKLRKLRRSHSNMSLLFTNHDKFHIHKTLGFACLTHYFVRIYFLLTYGTMFFDTKCIYTLMTPVLHLSLSVSSFIFHVPKYRFDRKAIIWKELQLHNIVFTSRSAMTMIHFLIFSHDGKNPIPNIFRTFNVLNSFDIYSILNIQGFASTIFYYSTRLIIIIGHHLIADTVTKYYIVEDKTTTRDIPWGQNISDISKKYIKLFYAICQCIAINSLILTSCDNSGKIFLESAFLIMFPIQLSAFLMTLVRKNIITNNMWHLFYGMSLISPYILVLNNDKGNVDFYIKVALTIMYVVLRLVFKVEKYFLMTNTLMLFLYYEKNN